ncbi:MAG: hypothetical protein HYW57_06490 [Ignavibacteriales bacterium]|nr:hypothetical protein [Ignavibacteriales bacterium]
MGVILDLIASMAVRGAIVYIVITMNIQLHELLYEKAQHAIVKQNTATVADIFRNDLRYLGYNVTGDVFKLADTNRVRFLGDLSPGDANTTPDTIYYYVGPTSEMSETPNPDDRIMYRRVNSGTPVDIGHGVVTFSFKYYDGTGAVTTDLASIKSLWVKIVMQGDRPINQFYPTSIWETDFHPGNI